MQLREIIALLEMTFELDKVIIEEVAGQCGDFDSAYQKLLDIQTQ